MACSEVSSRYENSNALNKYQSFWLHAIGLLPNTPKTKQFHDKFTLRHTSSQVMMILRKTYSSNTFLIAERGFCCHGFSINLILNEISCIVWAFLTLISHVPEKSKERKAKRKNGKRKKKERKKIESSHWVGKIDSFFNRFSSSLLFCHSAVVLLVEPFIRVAF